MITHRRQSYQLGNVTVAGPFGGQGNGYEDGKLLFDLQLREKKYKHIDRHKVS